MTPATSHPALPAMGWKEAFVFFGGTLFFFAVAALSLWFALKSHQARQRYEEGAVVTMGTVTGFETFTTRGRNGEAFHTLPVVEFNAEGRKLRARLLAARPVFPHQREGWIGRRIELRHPPGRPDKVIAADAIDRLPGISPSVLMGVAAGLAIMAVLLVCAWISLRRSSRKALHAHDAAG